MKNEQIEQLIGKLKKNSNTNNVMIWKSIALELQRPTRNRRIVNLFKLDKVTKKDDIVIVPGKVLSTGEISHKLTVAAYAFSKSAVDKIKKMNGEAISIEKLLEINPKGQKVRIIG